LSLNAAAMPLLEKNPEKIDWRWLSLNPSIFTNVARKDKEAWIQSLKNE
jgi:hypothetical protein